MRNYTTQFFACPVKNSFVKFSSYGGKWGTAFEKAAYRGGWSHLPEIPEEKRYAMKRDSDFIALRQPESVDAPLTEIAP